MAAEASFTARFLVGDLSLHIVGQLFFDLNIRIDSFGLDGAVRRGVVAGRREPDGAVGA